MSDATPVWTWPPANPVDAETVDLVGMRSIARNLPKLVRRSGGNYGPHGSRMRGRGMEFAETRPYQHGDDVRHIDWRVTARSTHTHTKLFQEERERPLLLWVDYRSAMHFATRGVFKSVLAARAAALLAWRSTLSGDRAGGMVFSEARETTVRPRRGPAAALHLAGNLDTRPWRNQQRGGTTTISDSIHALQRLARPGSAVALLSDFRGLDACHLEPLYRTARHCDLLLFRIYDRIEAELPPPGLYPVNSAGNRWLLNTRNNEVRNTHRQSFEERGRRLRELADATRAHLLECATDQDPLPLIRQACAGRWL